MVVERRGGNEDGISDYGTGSENLVRLRLKLEDRKIRVGVHDKTVMKFLNPEYLMK